MAAPLFCVDLSDDARDYRQTALEPGLPLLDQQGDHFQILRAWLGDYVAEPEWIAEHVVAFYRSTKQHGRLEAVACQPLTKTELERQFAGDLEVIRDRIRKAKADSSTARLVLRTLQRSLAEQTSGPNANGCDSYFFKCRAGNEAWQLVWCCGYQRADLEPLPAQIWHTADGDFLAVHPLQGVPIVKRKRHGPRATRAWRWAAALLLLLLLLLGGLAFATRPTLVVSPASWSGPAGGRIAFGIEERRWWFFVRDVTAWVVAQSHDPRIVDFDPHTKVANAKNEGQVAVSFRLGSRVAQAMLDVLPPARPDSLTIEPAAPVTLAADATQQLRAIGHYANGTSVDLTTQVDWWEEAESRLLCWPGRQKGLMQALRPGATKVVARYPQPLHPESDAYAEATLNVAVVPADFRSLRVSLEPGRLAVGQSGRIDVQALDTHGVAHSLCGSSGLRLQVDPSTIAALDQGHLVGRAEGAGTLRVGFEGLEQTVAFRVQGGAVSKTVLSVQPAEIEAVVDEAFSLHVMTGSLAPITVASSEPEVVEALGTTAEHVGYEVRLAARNAGQAEVTVTQGEKSQSVKVVVREVPIVSLEFQPPVLALHAGQPVRADLRGTTEDGRVIRIVPDRLRWEKQPQLQNVQLDRQSLTLTPLAPTDLPQDLQVRLAGSDVVAIGTLEVRESEFTPADVWRRNVTHFAVHPPVAGRRNYPDSPDAPARPVLVASARRPDNSVDAVREVRVSDVRPKHLSAEGFHAELQLDLRLTGDYRLTDAAGKSLSDWQTVSGGTTATLTSVRLPRSADDEYELYVERKIGDQVRRFQVPFTLSTSPTTR
jgi:hypothetical protein